jgi:DNA-binding response OmpR family regulator
MKNESILIVDNDTNVVLDKAPVLKKAGYNILITNDILYGMNKLYETNPDLLIVNQDLYKANKENPYIRVRRSSYVPIIVVGEEEKAAEMLELGADAYVVKPPDSSELIARIDSLMRRKRKMLQKQCGYEIEESKKFTQGKEKPQRLTPTECRLAKCLDLNTGQAMPNALIIREVWGGKKITAGTLHFHIRRLKSKLSNFQIFQLRGIGYYMLKNG